MMRVATSILMLGCSGCGTILTFSSPDSQKPPFQPRVFGGVRLDVLGVRKTASLGSAAGTLLAVAFLLDAPLSFIADLVTLPVTAILELARRSPAPVKEGEEPGTKRSDIGGKP